MSDKIRVEFEKHPSFAGLDMSSLGGIGYTSKRTNMAYRAWKAGYEAAQPKWLPIESAPLYDELGIIARKGYFVFWTNWDEEDGWYTVNMFYENSQSGKDRKWRPTHWQPLPPEGE